MKTIVCALLLACVAAPPAGAGTIDNAGTYHGTTNGVGVGFFAAVGVGLTDGATCNGQSVVVLLYSHAQYKDMLAVLLAAESAGKNVRMYRMLDSLQNFGGVSYCTITSVSLGDFPFW